MCRPGCGRPWMPRCSTRDVTRAAEHPTATWDGGPHPNPRKAAEGYRLRVLAVDEPTAEVVRRIFAQYLDGNGDRAIANGLNRDGIPCPSARRPDQNRHRLADGWQGSTVRSILENPRYTGYAFFGRWTKHETLRPFSSMSCDSARARGGPALAAWLSGPGGPATSAPSMALTGK